MTTDAVVNETGFDSRLRVRVPMGVAYGSDLRKVKQVLLEIANERKDILRRPKPNVRYRTFGETAIGLELRVVISNPARRGRVIDELIMDIEKRFRKEGIVISPPSEQKIFVESRAIEQET